MPLFGQLPHTFTPLRHINAQYVNHIVFNSEDTLYASCGDNGLNVYIKNNGSYSLASHIDEGGREWDPHLGYYDIGNASDLLLFGDDIILANGIDGTRAYHLEGANLVCRDYIDNKQYYAGGNAKGLAKYNDSTVLQANYSNGLRAYEYLNGSFSKLGFINNGDYYNNVCVASDKTIFVANGGDGLRVYTFEGSDFKYKGKIDDGGYAYDVTVSEDGVVFLANREDGLRAYSYNKNSNTMYPIVSEEVSDHVTLQRVTIAPDGTIFVAMKNGGASAYDYDGQSFKFKGWLNSYSYASDGGVKSVAAINDSTIVVAHSGHGIKTYDCDYDARRLYKTAEFYNNDYVHDVAVNKNGIIYAACSKGLRAYSYNPSDSSIIQLTPSDNMGNVKAIDISDDGTVFAAYDDGTVRSYEFRGTSFRPKARVADEYRRAYDIDVLGNEYVFVVKQTGGLYAYRYNGVSLIEVDHFVVNDAAMSVAVSKDSIVVLGCGNSVYEFVFKGEKLVLTDAKDGVMGYDFNFSDDGTLFGISEDYLTSYCVRGYALENIAHINNGGCAYGVKVFDNNLVFLADGNKGIQAYTFDGSDFHLRAEIYESGNAVNLEISSDSTIYTATGSGGIRVYKYSGFSEIELIQDSLADNNGSELDTTDDPGYDPTLPNTYKLYQNYPNPFNPATTIQYYMINKADVHITIYDVSGKQIKQWYFENREQGFHSVIWDGKNENNKLMPNGVYICQIAVRYYDLFLESKKMLLLK